MINLGELDEALTISEKRRLILKEDWAKKLIPPSGSNNKQKDKERQ